MKLKYNNGVKLCYMDTDSFIMNIKTNDFYEDIASDVEKRFDTSNYDDGKEDKKAKGTKNCVIKKMIKFNDYKKCLLNDEVMLKPQQRFISKKPNVYTENINKIALSNNDDKRIVSSNKITSYPYGYVLKN